MILHVADQKGFFETNGLNVELIATDNGAQATAAIASGALEVVDCAPALCLPLMATGEELVLYGGIKTYPLAIIANPAIAEGMSFPESVQALEGKRVGVPALGSGGHYFMMAAASAAGMDTDDVEYVPVGGNPQGLAALESGQIDAWTASGPGLAIALENDYGEILVDLRRSSDAIEDVPLLGDLAGAPYGSMWSKRDWFERNPNTIAALRLAMMEADCWMHDPENFDEYMEIVVGMGLPEAITGDLATEYVRDNMMGLSYFPKDAAAAWMEFGVEYGMIDAPAPVDEWYDADTPQTQADVVRAVTTAGGTCAAYEDQ